MIYPNPTNGTVSIIIQKNVKAFAEVYNAFGEGIYKKDLKEEKTEIDLSDQASGIYFIRIGSVTKKIIKE